MLEYSAQTPKGRGRFYHKEFPMRKQQGLPRKALYLKFKLFFVFEFVISVKF